MDDALSSPATPSHSHRDGLASEPLTPALSPRARGSAREDTLTQQEREPAKELPYSEDVVSPTLTAALSQGEREETVPPEFANEPPKRSKRRQTAHLKLVPQDRKLRDELQLLPVGKRIVEGFKSGQGGIDRRDLRGQNRLPRSNPVDDIGGRLLGRRNAFVREGGLRGERGGAEILKERCLLVGEIEPAGGSVERGFEPLTALRRAGHAEQIRAAHYVLCATLDDVVLNTPWGSQSPWATSSLISTFHRETGSGDRFFALLEHLKPGSLYFPEAWAAAPDRLETARYVYFSFVTLATLGYGDIVPRTVDASGLVVAEAVVGQLYLAVLVARLVGLHLAGRHARDE